MHPAAPSPVPPYPGEKAPGLALTIVITFLFGLFGLIPAAIAASRARRARYPEGRYWVAFGATMVASIVAYALVVVAALSALTAVTGQGTPAAGGGAPAPTATASSAAPVPGDMGSVIVVGSSSAPVTVDLYEDFLCPNCKTFEQANGAALAKLVAAGTVQLHHHPMAFLDTNSNQQYATRALNAAAVVRVAAGPVGYQKFHDLLFANQPAESGPGLSDDELIAYAQQAGATGPAVEQQIRDLAYGSWVTKVTDQASQDGVTGTPTVFVNGRRIDDLSESGLTAAIDSAKHGG